MKKHKKADILLHFSSSENPSYSMGKKHKLQIIMVDLKSQPKLVHHLRLNTDFLLFSKKKIIEKMCKKRSKLTKKQQTVTQNPDHKNIL